MLRNEYVKLTEDLDADLVAQHTLDLGQYLLGLSARGQLPPPPRAAARTRRLPPAVPSPRLGIGTPGLELLRKVPELDVEFIDRGCSGMGGTYGPAHDRFRNERHHQLRVNWRCVQEARGLAEPRYSAIACGGKGAGQTTIAFNQPLPDHGSPIN